MLPTIAHFGPADSTAPCAGWPKKSCRPAVTSGKFQAANLPQLGKYACPQAWIVMQIRKAMTQAGQRHMLTGIVKMMEKTQPLKVIAGAPDRPLIIGDIEIPCYVLEDETRVLSQRGVTCAIKLNPDVGFRMPQFLSSKALYFSGVTAGFFSPYSVQKSILEKLIAKELQPWTKTSPMSSPSRFCASKAGRDQRASGGRVSQDTIRTILSTNAQPPGSSLSCAGSTRRCPTGAARTNTTSGSPRAWDTPNSRSIWPPSSC